jgi:hypothetical protein
VMHATPNQHMSFNEPIICLNQMENLKAGDNLYILMVCLYCNGSCISVGGGGPTYGGGGGGYPRGGGASMRGATGPPRMYAMRGSPPKALGGGGVWGGQRLPPGVGAVTAVSRQQPMYGGGARVFQGRGAG